MEISCKHCSSDKIERRGTVRSRGAVLQRIKCLTCAKWSRTLVTKEDILLFDRTEEEISEYTKKETYIVTSVQNNTPVDKKFLKGLKRLAAHYDAQILAIPVLYNTQAKRDDIWFAKDVVPYIVQNEIHLPYGVRVMGNVRIAATAVNPLTGFESLTQADSAVFGHGQIQMKTVPTPQNRLPKILTTTGSCSIKNYTATKAGIKGDFHHSLGAVVIELDHDLEIAHIRNITGDNDSEFYDLDLHVTDRRVRKINNIPALVTGDEHHKFIDPDVVEATYTDSDSIVNTLKPRYIVRHDIVDSYSISHHHRQSPSTRYNKHRNNDDGLEDELHISARFLEETTPDFATNVVVMSNHHNHIKRWLEETEWRQDMKNARLYHEMWAAWLTAIDEHRYFHPFIWWMKNNCNSDTLYLTDDYPFFVEGVYLGYHGDRGPNGARGNIRNLNKIGAKTVIGHTHSPGIDKGCYQVGTSSWLKLEYTQGPLSWLHTHCLVHKNGKRQLVHIIKGAWRKDR